MRALVVGGAGVLGSSLVEMLVEKGFDVKVVDVVRREEAWRLEAVIDRIEYVWKSVFDLDREDVEGVDLVVHSMAQADRPLGDTSPYHTVHDNVLSTLRVLEAVRRLGRRPVVIYPSSLNEYYGHTGVIDEETPPKPASVYGFSKAAASMLVETYRRAYGVPTIVTIVGSAFSKRMRSDELVAKLVIYGLKGRRLKLRSPHARRLWTYGGDVVEFYARLVERLDEFVGMRLICAGNRGDEVVSNVELAERVRRLVPTLEYELGEYEPGELVDGRPVCPRVNAERTRRLLNWRPRYSLDEGLAEVVEWFRGNLWRYV